MSRGPLIEMAVVGNAARAAAAADAAFAGRSSSQDRFPEATGARGAFEFIAPLYRSAALSSK